MDSYVSEILVYRAHPGIIGYVHTCGPLCQSIHKIEYSIPGLSEGSLCAYMWTLSMILFHPRTVHRKPMCIHMDPYVRVSMKSWDSVSIQGLSKGSLYMCIYTCGPLCQRNPRILCPSQDCPKEAYVHICGPLCQSIHEILGYNVHPGIVQRWLCAYMWTPIWGKPERAPHLQETFCGYGIYICR